MSHQVQTFLMMAVFALDLILHVSYRVLSLTGRHVCKDGPAEWCCTGYREANGSCYPCSIGTFGANCSFSCPAGHNGQFCLETCNCTSQEVCSPMYGCLSNDGYEDNNTLPGRPFPSEDCAEREMDPKHVIIAVFVTLCFSVILNVTYFRCIKRNQRIEKVRYSLVQGLSLHSRPFFRRFSTNIPNTDTSSTARENSMRRFDDEMRLHQSFDTEHLSLETPKNHICSLARNELYEKSRFTNDYQQIELAPRVFQCETLNLTGQDYSDVPQRCVEISSIPSRKSSYRDGSKEEWVLPFTSSQFHSWNKSSDSESVINEEPDETDF